MGRGARGRRPAPRAPRPRTKSAPRVPRAPRAPPGSRRPGPGPGLHPPGHISTAGSSTLHQFGSRTGRDPRPALLSNHSLQLKCLSPAVAPRIDGAPHHWHCNTGHRRSLAQLFLDRAFALNRQAVGDGTSFHSKEHQRCAGPVFHIRMNSEEAAACAPVQHHSLSHVSI